MRYAMPRHTDPPEVDPLAHFTALARKVLQLAIQEVVYRNLQGPGVIDRELANALHGLTFHIQGDIDGMLERGIVVSDRFISNELVRMLLMVESILEDEWMLD